MNTNTITAWPKPEAIILGARQSYYIHEIAFPSLLGIPFFTYSRTVKEDENFWDQVANDGKARLRSNIDKHMLFLAVELSDQAQDLYTLRTGREAPRIVAQSIDARRLPRLTTGKRNYHASWERAGEFFQTPRTMSKLCPVLTTIRAPSEMQNPNVSSWRVAGEEIVGELGLLSTWGTMLTGDKRYFDAIEVDAAGAAPTRHVYINEDQMDPEKVYLWKAVRPVARYSLRNKRWEIIRFSNIMTSMTYQDAQEGSHLWTPGFRAFQQVIDRLSAGKQAVVELVEKHRPTRQWTGGKTHKFWSDNSWANSHFEGIPGKKTRSRSVSNSVLSAFMAKSAIATLPEKQKLAKLEAMLWRVETEKQRELLVAKIQKARDAFEDAKRSLLDYSDYKKNLRGSNIVVRSVTTSHRRYRSDKDMVNGLRDWETIKGVSFETVQPTIIRIDKEERGDDAPTVAAGPFYVSVTQQSSGEIKMAVAPKNESCIAVSIEPESSYTKFHPHLPRVYRAQIGSYTDIRRDNQEYACLGEAEPAMHEAFENADLEHVLAIAMAWLSNAYSNDAWGKDAPLFPAAAAVPLAT